MECRGCIRWSWWRQPSLAVLTLLFAELALPRPLPDKNELANACYFTYRVGYIICDSGLGPEEAQREMEAGRCNEDFRLMGSDFQRRIVRHYSSGGPPPLEEAMWLLNAPENFQMRTLKECPAMQIMACLLIAEAKLYTHGPKSIGTAVELATLALEQAQHVPLDVYSALAKAWPMDMALNRFQASFQMLQSLVQTRSTAQSPFEVHVVLCHCVENLDWLEELTVPLSYITLFVYGGCAKNPTVGALGIRLQAFKAVHLQQKDEHFLGANGECAARGVLHHILEVTMVDIPTFTMFLSTVPTQGAERHFLELVLQTLAERTLDIPFLPLGFERSMPNVPTACERAVRQNYFGSRFPSGYKGARFLVSGARIIEKPTDYYLHLLSIFDNPPAACGVGDDSASDLREVLSPAWHAVFGEASVFPIREDDNRLPVFLRFADGPSGFQQTRLPKTSAYLTNVEAETVAGTFRLHQSSD